MLRRILVDVLGTLAVIALLSGSVAGYFWLKGRPERAQLRKEADEFIAGLVAQKKALDKLGDVDFGTASLTFEALTERLGQPTIRKSGANRSTALGWLCADKSCAIIASFMTPFGREIPANSSPVVIVMMKPIVSVTHTLSIDGVRLGSSVEDIERNCKKRGYGAALAQDKIACDDGWSVKSTAPLDGQVTALIFSNDRVLEKSSFHNSSCKADESRTP